MSEADQLELTMDEAKARIAFSKDVLELLESPLFKKVITDKYIVEGREDLVSRLADPRMQSEAEIAYNTKALVGVAFLGNWLEAHVKDGEQAEVELREARRVVQLLEEEEGEV